MELEHKVIKLLNIMSDVLEEHEDLQGAFIPALTSALVTAVDGVTGMDNLEERDKVIFFLKGNDANGHPAMVSIDYDISPFLSYLESIGVPGSDFNFKSLYTIAKDISGLEEADGESESGVPEYKSIH